MFQAVVKIWVSEVVRGKAGLMGFVSLVANTVVIREAEGGLLLLLVLVML